MKYSLLLAAAESDLNTPIPWPNVVVIVAFVIFACWFIHCVTRRDD